MNAKIPEYILEIIQQDDVGRCSFLIPYWNKEYEDEIVQICQGFRSFKIMTNILLNYIFWRPENISEIIIQIIKSRNIDILEVLFGYTGFVELINNNYKFIDILLKTRDFDLIKLFALNDIKLPYNLNYERLFEYGFWNEIIIFLRYSETNIYVTLKILLSLNSFSYEKSTIMLSYELDVLREIVFSLINNKMALKYKMLICNKYKSIKKRYNEYNHIENTKLV